MKSETVGNTSVQFSTSYDAAVFSNLPQLLTIAKNYFGNRIVHSEITEGNLDVDILRPRVSESRAFANFLRITFEPSKIRVSCVDENGSLDDIETLLKEVREEHEAMGKMVEVQLGLANLPLSKEHKYYASSLGVDCFRYLLQFDLKLGGVFNTLPMGQFLEPLPLVTHVSAILRSKPKENMTLPEGLAETMANPGFVDVEWDTTSDAPACKVITISNLSPMLHIEILRSLLHSAERQH